MIAALPLVSSAITSLLGPAQAVSGQAVSAGAAGAAAPASGDGFGSFLASLSKGTVDKMNAAESVSADGLQGKATTQSVVEAVVNAQESLQTALAIRDKAVSALLDVSKMPI